ncbi:MULTISPECIES: bifunctional 4-hydroxy-2-oxoglutarate aldolase/2-dehydro-3-deoxy-phosphogluconate aldolase [Crocosphaera]|uniref:4-Hydroxy-2-oxoglutarate aldolase / 2-dehydro-3-deoxyphosphogluconate aldolase n=4 Tax=Crocosphaera watsonii TaxID=263511 RepID=T2JZT3_CROWT|nr:MULTISPECIES: bifunctional 4-hydroxy-2-oxoglutarate aldolase/2-dehydro-3-deoxy-phosphogluconate aldolase [Crocosphaera]EHJ11643.1 4-Hydroxy-2-oxoglutarate aldolase / 2-dehydro-3-deoxyphosphogluconate aldolase [Crocosphaera watsonii WH 0003]MCH2245224.1 bifunctional 4-hydroxy-2-oxoglutarate aldolase/2-dehydro-3-deoxy-phosphogluconate aldolase [Crocosphaera sp.]NQZ60705.1 bifunctional 4-hydroxy-2-oxoglutarate aldolase/2-dehydro-3-deoxy-phosphogluconate aldolase [Crocosphaera sp.]CCQ49012.1 4-H
MEANKTLNSSQSWRKLLTKNPAIAVIRTDNIEQGINMAKAVAAGGMNIIEITWNSHNPGEIIQQLKQDLPECTIGTGTILTLEELKEAIASGIQFCFTPHVNQTLIKTAINHDIPIIPGALSPTEIITAWQAGASCVKVFPVQAIGGIAYIKGLQGPLGSIPLIPTGGVTLDNAAYFIEAGAIAVGLSSQLFPRHALDDQKWDTITAQAQLLMERLSKFQQ